MLLSPQSAHFAGRESRHAAKTCPFKIVTFYDGFADAIRAHKAFNSISQRYCGDRPVNSTSWSFSLLVKPQLNAAIRRDVARPDLLIVAANGDQPLPASVATWVRFCMKGNPSAKPVLVALPGDSLTPAAEAVPMCASLEEIANHSHTTFAVNTDWEGSANDDCPPEPLGSQRVVKGSAVLAGQRHPTAASQRWWGIND